MCIAHYIANSRKERKRNPDPIPQNTTNSYADKHAITNEKDAWMPSLENWGGGLKIFYG